MCAHIGQIRTEAVNRKKKSQNNFSNKFMGENEHYIWRYCWNVRLSSYLPNRTLDVKGIFVGSSTKNDFIIAFQFSYFDFKDWKSMNLPFTCVGKLLLLQIEFSLFKVSSCCVLEISTFCLEITHPLLLLYTHHLLLDFIWNSNKKATFCGPTFPCSRLLPSNLDSLLQAWSNGLASQFPT